METLQRRFEIPGVARPALLVAKRRLAGLSLFVLLLLASVGSASAASWVKVTNLAPSSVQLMIQMTDGTLLVQSYNGHTWMKLTPDSHGSYINGTWSLVADEPTPRIYFASKVLQNGKLWVLGGEYTGPGLLANWSNTGEIYDPVANSWTPMAPYPNQAGCPQINYVAGSTTNGSNIITGIYPYTSHLVVGWTVSGTGIPAGSTITSVDSATQIHISQNATSSTTGEKLTLNHNYQLIGCFGDDPSMLLPGSQILAGDLISRNTYLYNLATDAWVPSGNKVYNDPSDEEGWVKQADGTVLTYDLFQSIATGGSYAEKYTPDSGIWSDISPSAGTASGTIPQLSSSALGYELGPLLRLQDGRVLAIGATQHTAFYTAGTNTWAAGPDISGLVSGNPTAFGGDDAPAAILPNGHVIFAADTGPAHAAPFQPPTQLFDFNPSTNAISPVSPAIPDANLPNEPAYPTRMLVLPNGQLLFSDSSAQLWVYTPDGMPSPALRPVINNVAYNGGGVFTMTGQQLTGQSAGAAYGDDDQMDTNYPIVRMTSSTGTVYYARTTNWSSTGVDGGTSPETVNFKLNPSLPAGNYSVIVSGAGIQSFPIFVSITQAEVNGQ